MMNGKRSEGKQKDIYASHSVTGTLPTRALEH